MMSDTGRTITVIGLDSKQKTLHDNVRGNVPPYTAGISIVLQIYIFTQYVITYVVKSEISSFQLKTEFKFRN